MGHLKSWLLRFGNGDKTDSASPPANWYRQEHLEPAATNSSFPSPALKSAAERNNGSFLPVPQRGPASSDGSVVSEEKDVAAYSPTAGNAGLGSSPRGGRFSLLQSLRLPAASGSSVSSPILKTLSVAAERSSGDGRAEASPGPPVITDVKATDYATPQKYLEDPSKIPSYYVFQSNMVTEDDLQPGMIRVLDVDKRLTVPTRTHIKFLVTATDVIHSFAVPALGIKADAVPGRLVKVNTFIQREGVFYGQCSELCGTLHAFMPIVVEAVSPETYAAHAKKYYREE